MSVEDGHAVPHVIDFGVAKALNQRLAEETVFTQLGLLVGTPEYMSPEQAEMSPLGVDTTSDVYSLGVLLYELLVGELPFDSNLLRRAGYPSSSALSARRNPRGQALAWPDWVIRPARSQSKDKRTCRH